VFSHVFNVSSVAKNTFTPLLDIMNVSPPTETFISELSALVEFLESDDLPLDRFGAFNLTGLRTIADAYGRDSEQYSTAAASLTAALRSALTKPYLNLVIFTYPEVRPGGMAKRQAQSPLPSRVPVPPVGSDVLCYTSEDICTNSTESCSGHGTCALANKAGRTCFICSCEATKDSKGRTEHWAGSKCERKDVSGYVRFVPPHVPADLVSHLIDQSVRFDCWDSDHTHIDRGRLCYPTFKRRKPASSQRVD
jgi:Domain of unknown function (DUF3844)